MPDWTNFLSAMTLALVRVSGMVAFAPFFSSTALPMRAKAVFVGAVAFLLAPLVATLAQRAGDAQLFGDHRRARVGLVYGLSLTLLNEMLLFAGQIAGLQFSFSLVNLLDPASAIQTPLLGDLFQLMGTLVVITAGLDRILLASMVRSFRVVPLGTLRWLRRRRWRSCAPREASFWPRSSWPRRCWPHHAGRDRRGAAGQAEPAVAGDELTVPLKTLTGFVILTGSLALWPRFIEARFAGCSTWPSG
jgi:flagellar biosynthesis protein FliR